MFGLNPGSICSILTIFFISYYNKPILFKIYNDFNFFYGVSVLMRSH